MNQVALPDSLWAATAVPAPVTQELVGEVTVDTAIVGAGFTGLRAALQLAEAGQRVGVVDARTVGWGASGRNGGQVNPLPTVHGPDEVGKRIGAAFLERFAEAALGSADELFDLIAEYGIDCQARQKGWLRLDHCRDARRKSRAIATGWNRFGADIEFLDGTDLHDELGSRAFRSGTLIRKGGAVQPLSLARGLAVCAQDAGAAIYSQSPATALAKKGKGWHLRTPRGGLVADQVLLCANGYTDRLWPGLAQSVLPLVSIQAATAPLPESSVETILRQGRTFADTRREIIYGRREADGRILIGGLGRLSERGDIAAFADLRREAERIFPALGGATWQYRWSGRLAVTRDHIPHLHEPAPGVLAGLGYNGRGVAMANVMGRVLAERILGKTPDEIPFPIKPISAFPLHRFHEIGARAMMWWMRWQDRREAARG